AESIAEDLEKKNAATTEKKEEPEKSTDADKAKTDDKPAETGPDVQSDAAILVNSNTGKIIYEKNAHKRMYPASTTKIMTAYLALNHLDLTNELTVSQTAIDIPSDSSAMGLLAGEVLTTEMLLHALMIQSANDAANVLAEAVSGSITDFVALMNQTAQELGMENTHFCNPHGYHDDNHYTTAYDMAIIAQKAMENSTFATIVSKKSIKIPPTNKYQKERIFATRNSLINNHSSLPLQYSYANGIKTGYTDKAGQCLVGSAKRNGMDLISVVFHAPKNAPDRVFIDTKNLFLHANTTYTIKTVLKADALASTCNIRWASGKSHMILKAMQDVKALLPRNGYNEALLTNEITIYDNITAPVKEGQQLGEIKYYYDKQEVATASLFASRDVSRNYLKQFFSYVLNIWFILILGVIVLILLLLRRKEKRRIAKIRRLRNRQKRGGLFDK
ncbi:MAG: D-alanyl-D-alanine carboxypeptidase, partial [Clostridia bacterium]|nr:D-alanyl-D-alanine carboxypeptidase [Clostridia bacterium]